MFSRALSQLVAGASQGWSAVTRVQVAELAIAVMIGALLTVSLSREPITRMAGTTTMTATIAVVAPAASPGELNFVLDLRVKRHEQHRKGERPDERRQKRKGDKVAQDKAEKYPGSEQHVADARAAFGLPFNHSAFPKRGASSIQSAAAWTVRQAAISQGRTRI